MVASNAAIAFANQKIIAHGGGTVNGFQTSNSVEAVNQAIKDGIEFIELDMNLTTDGKVVMLHDWNSTTLHYLGEKLTGPFSSKDLERYKVFKKFEPLTLEKLIPIIEANPNVKIITDTKEETVKILTIIATSYPEYINNFIPQIYFYEEHDPVKALGYKDIILTVYRQNKPDAAELVKFAKEKNLMAVTMPNYEAEKGLCNAVASQGVNVFVHPIYTMEEAKRFFSMGAKMVYASEILPYEFEGMESRYYLSLKTDSGLKKLVDETFDNFNGSIQMTLNGEGVLGRSELKLMGLSNGEYAVCYVEKRDDLAAINPNAIAVVIELYNGNKEKFNQVEYLAVQSEKEIRILHPKVKYRLAEMKNPADFENISTYEEAKEILRNSIIAKKGESIYYSNGVGKAFMTGNDRLNVIGGFMDRNMIPLADTLTALGADNITLESNSRLIIDYKGQNYRVYVGNPSVMKGMTRVDLQDPVTIYRQKAMASANTIEKITNRRYIESEDVTIILPEGVKVDQNLKTDLIKAVLPLFN